MSFTTVDNVKLVLGIPVADTSQDSLLTLYVDAANAELLGLFHLDECGSKQYTLQYDVLDADTRGFWLRQYPVITVDTVTVAGSVLAVDEYYLEARTARMGSLMRKLTGSSSAFACWPVGPQIVEVVHTAGWAGAVVDKDLAAAATMLVVWAYNTGPKTGFDSERIGQYFYKLASGGSAGFGGGGAGGFPAPVARVLAQWRRVFAEWS